MDHGECIPSDSGFTRAHTHKGQKGTWVFRSEATPAERERARVSAALPDIPLRFVWTVDSAVWQVGYGGQSRARDSAFAWLKDQIENGSALATTDIAAKLLYTVASVRWPGND